MPIGHLVIATGHVCHVSAHQELVCLPLGIEPWVEQRKVLHEDRLTVTNLLYDTLQPVGAGVIFLELEHHDGMFASFVRYDKKRFFVLLSDFFNGEQEHVPFFQLIIHSI